MLFGAYSALRAAVLAVIASLALSGCATSAAITTSGPGSSPQRAVATFLAPFPSTLLAGLTESEQRRRALALWRTMCDRVDPAIRRGLRVNDEVTIPDRRAACGAVVMVMALEPGDGSGIAAPATIAGRPRAAVTQVNTSIVTVDVRYRAMPNATAPPPPARATVRTLVVKRDGRWWVATPNAFNPAYARRGGLTEGQLRQSYAKLLAAAR
jgi:hypothetical protein